MELYVDGKKSAHLFKDDQSVNDVVDVVRDDMLTGGDAILGLTCDGIDVSEERIAEVWGREVGEVKRIDIATGKPDELVIDALEQATEQLDETSNLKQEAIDQFGKGATTDAIRTLGQCLSSWLGVNDTINKSYSLLSVTNKPFADEQQKLADMLQPVTEQLTEIKNAMEAADYVTIADILEYEFDGVQKNWQGCIDMILSHTSAGSQAAMQTACS